MREGRPEDLPRIVELWRHEVEVGRQDAAPSESRMRARLARFDWSHSRVVERDGRLDGVVFVFARPSPGGVQADVYPSGRGDAYPEVANWGVRFARAAGASVIHAIVARGSGADLEQFGLRAVRPWWRMDRSLDTAIPEAIGVDGYSLIDGLSAAPGTWADAFNRSFADHWRFVPRSEPDIVAGKPPRMCLMALTSPGYAPAAITLGELEEYEGDPRSQPVGLISSVGTVPEHRRRGLARWLVAEVLHRLRGAGARHASLYVDGLNNTRAYDVYRRLGFEVAYEAEVWEATAR